LNKKKIKEAIQFRLSFFLIYHFGESVEKVLDMILEEERQSFLHLKDKTQIEIRRTTRDHKGEYVAIKNKAYPYTWGGTNPKQPTFQANKGDTIIGYITMTQNYVYDIAVHPHYYHQGVGTKLLLEVAQNLNTVDILLDVRATNKVAVACYKKLGFEVVGRSLCGHYDWHGGIEMTVEVRKLLEKLSNCK